MSYYSNIGSATPDGGRPNVATGDCILEFQSCEVRAPNPGKNTGITLVVEVVVVSHDNAADAPGVERKIAFTDLDRPGKGEKQMYRIRTLIAAMWNIDPFAANPCEGFTWVEAYEYMTGSHGQNREEQNDNPFAGCHFQASSYDQEVKSINPQTMKHNTFRMWTFLPVQG